MGSPSLDRLAFSATAHCLTGCAIGEVLGFVIGTALGWGDWPTMALAIVLAFFFGYSLTLLPLVRAGLTLAAAARTTTDARMAEALAKGGARRPRSGRTRSRRGSRS